MWKLCYTDAHIKAESAFSILIVFGLFTLEICYLSLKHSVLFNTLNRFNVNIESLQTIYRTNILQTNIS